MAMTWLFGLLSQEEEAVPRTPLRVISNANGSQTVLRTTRATAKKASVVRSPPIPSHACARTCIFT